MILRLINIWISANITIIGPWPNMKVLKASDQKYEADLNIGSFFFMFDKEHIGEKAPPS